MHKSAGPDGLHPPVLKETAEVICIPLAKLLNKFLEQGKFAQEWKM